ARPRRTNRPSEPVRRVTTRSGTATSPRRTSTRTPRVATPAGAVTRPASTETCAAAARAEAAGSGTTRPACSTIAGTELGETERGGSRVTSYRPGATGVERY